ncbi:MAG: Crp/Fnr family transcriptional regulator [Acidobacteriota bacterium]|nr:Crp/Fnr family transcriptional regulator [Acidobacteriota bacterium]
MFLLRPERLPSELNTAVTHRELGPGEFLYYRGDPAVSIFAVQRGRLRLFSHTADGKPVPLYVIRPGECVAEAALFADKYCGDVVAEVASRVAIFPKKAVLTAFHAVPQLADEFMALLTNRFNLLRVRLELRNVPSARERVVQYLLFTAAPGATRIKLDRPLKSIAEDLDLTHESFYRALAQLVKEGRIIRRIGSIEFQSPDRHCAAQCSHPASAER